MAIARRSIFAAKIVRQPEGFPFFFVRVPITRGIGRPEILDFAFRGCGWLCLKSVGVCLVTRAKPSRNRWKPLARAHTIARVARGHARRASFLPRRIEGASRFSPSFGGHARRRQGDPSPARTRLAFSAFSGSERLRRRDTRRWPPPASAQHPWLRSARPRISLPHGRPQRRASAGAPSARAPCAFALVTERPGKWSSPRRSRGDDERDARREVARCNAVRVHILTLSSLPDVVPARQRPTARFAPPRAGRMTTPEAMPRTTTFTTVLRARLGHLHRAAAAAAEPFFGGYSAGAPPAPTTPSPSTTPPPSTTLHPRARGSAGPTCRIWRMFPTTRRPGPRLGAGTGSEGLYSLQDARRRTSQWISSSRSRGRGRASGRTLLRLRWDECRQGRQAGDPAVLPRGLAQVQGGEERGALMPQRRRWR